MTIKDFYRNSLVKNSIILTTAAIVSGLLNYLFQFFSSRKLSVADFGELQSLVAIMTIVSIVGGAISYFIIKHNSVLAKNRDYASSNAFLNILYGKLRFIYFILVVVVLLLAPVVFYGLHISLINYFLIAIAALLSMIVTINTSFLQSWQEFKSSSLTGVFSSLAKLILAIILLTILPKIFSAVLTYLLSTVITIIFLWYIFRKKGFGNKKETNNEAILKYFSIGALKKSIIPIFIYTLFLTFLQNADILIVKFYGSAELTGYYSVLSLVGKIILWVNLSIVAAILPHACADCDQGQILDKRVKRMADFLLIFTGVVAIVIYYFFPSMIINILFGSKYLIVGNYLWLSGIFALLISLISNELNLDFARGKYKLVYVLCLPLLAMFTLTYFFHSQLADILIINIFSFSVTYILILVIKAIERYGENHLNHRTGL